MCRAGPTVGLATLADCATIIIDERGHRNSADIVSWKEYDRWIVADRFCGSVNSNIPVCRSASSAGLVGGSWSVSFSVWHGNPGKYLTLCFIPCHGRGIPSSACRICRSSAPALDCNHLLHDRKEDIALFQITSASRCLEAGEEY